MQPQSRTYLLNILLAFIPDLIVSWAAARLTDSGWSGFFLTLVVLQAIYCFFWFKNALWAWLLFWIYRKRQMAAHLENYFIDNRFPTPDKYTTDLDDYLGEISGKEALDASVRVKAAFELGTLHGFRVTQRVSLVLMLTIAGGVALKRYARLAQSF